MGRCWRFVVVLLAIGAVSVLPGCEVKTTPPTTTGPAKVHEQTAPSTTDETQTAQGGDKASPNPESSKPGDQTPGESSLGAKASPVATSASSTISAEGSSTVYPICQSFAVEFEKRTKNTVSIGMQGTGGGYKKFVNRQADIWNASRGIDPKEVKELAEKGIEWLELNIAVDGIVIAVNPKNTWCSNITCEQLKQIWEPDSKVKTWSDVDPSWPAEPILLYGADTDSGTFEYFTEVINEKKKATNTNYTPASNDNVLVQGIASNKTALGYIPFGYYIDNTEKLKALGIAAKTNPGEAQKPFVEPSEETILSSEYVPLARPLYMYVNKSSLKRPEVAEFLRFAVSKESQSLIGKRGFVKVKEEERLKAVAKLEDAIKERPSPQ